MYFEKLYIHIYGAKEFEAFLSKFGIKYNNPIYHDFGKRNEKDEIIKYAFMVGENYDFAHHMKTVPSYIYIKILNEFLFKKEVIDSTSDEWNYYSVSVNSWYPNIMDLLNLTGIKTDEKNKKLIIPPVEHIPETEDFLRYSFNDVFFDYIRKEINESSKNKNYLCVMFLSRKLLEVMFVRILETVFPKIVNGEYNERNHVIWYNKNRHRYHDFDVLIENLIKNGKKFDEDGILIKDMCSKVKPFKDETNLFIHRDYKIPDEEYLKSWKIDEIINLTRKLFIKYCNP